MVARSDRASSPRVSPPKGVEFASRPAVDFWEEAPIAVVGLLPDVFLAKDSVGPQLTLLTSPEAYSTGHISSVSHTSAPHPSEVKYLTYVTYGRKIKP